MDGLLRCPSAEIEPFEGRLVNKKILGGLSLQCPRWRIKLNMGILYIVGKEIFC